uniref:BamA/TamA family outer membrane protein n=1 Tax=Winogradskyella helgolandensis TaxID=2697010 RepID=UPI003742CE59
MSPSTIINLSATSQQNIGLDKQAISGVFSYNWFPSNTVTNTLELFNVNFVKNLNTSNYFGVYTNSFSSLNSIAQDINYIGSDESLYDSSLSNSYAPADDFISDVLTGNTSLTSNDNDFTTVNNIEERKERLTENNLIFSTSFDYKKDKRKNIFDNDFSVFKWRVELAGNFLSGISSLAGAPKNDAGNYEVFGVAFSQYFKTEIDYVKYIDLGRKNVLAFRSYAGIAIPFGNSNSIPFAESFFAGGPNDNRAWTAYNLGPGSSKSTNEFNEANFKIHLSAEQRFSLFGAFQGAVFVDAGNIWNALDNVTDDAATFTSFNSLKDIAVGSGFGIRYDFDFFVLRFDVGLKTYDPSQSDKNRWFRDYNFRNAVYNIGINYPF